MYYFGYDMDPEKFREAMLGVLDKLGESERDWEEDKIFVDGEFDSNQTDFERQSNRCEIGVKARSKLEGYILLFFLRMIVDKYFALGIVWIVDNDDDDLNINPNSISIDDIIKVYKGLETQYTSIHDQNDSVRVELSGYSSTKGYYAEKIDVKPDEMDIWDLGRIRKYVQDISHEELNLNRF
jgi:hypothetical protein